MNHFAAIDQAREYAAGQGLESGSIIEFVHSTDGTRFLACKGGLRALASALSRKPMPEITRLVAEHALSPLSSSQCSEHLNCRRCGVSVDSDAYRQQEWASVGGAKICVDTYYCESCRRLLSAIGDGEYTDLQARAAHVPSSDPYTKSDL